MALVPDCLLGQRVGQGHWETSGEEGGWGKAVALVIQVLLRGRRVLTSRMWGERVRGWASFTITTRGWSYLSSGPTYQSASAPAASVSRLWMDVNEESMNVSGVHARVINQPPSGDERGARVGMEVHWGLTSPT